jgi:hypothetical protein
MNFMAITGTEIQKKFDPLKINTRTPKQKSFGALYQDTINRDLTIVSAGYNLISIWESDYVSLFQKSSHGKTIH